MSPRRAAVLLALALVAVLSPAAPPAWAQPGQVSTVSFVEASRTSLTLSWPRVSGATSYEVFRSIHKQTPYTKLVKRTTGRRTTVGGLVPGRTYCFQVRAKAGSSVGFRSAHTCKPTIRAAAEPSGKSIGVMTFNACSNACSGWSRRAPYARKVVDARNPDVLATQEAGAWTTPPSGYAQAYSKSAKRLFYKKTRFTLASDGSSGARAGEITLSPGKYAVWAELVDRATYKRILFVNAHTTHVGSSYALRGREVDNLITRMNQINTAGREVVYAGDFNSHKGRGTYNESTGFGSQDTVGRRFAASGYYDAYDLARNLHRPNWNSYSGFSAVPTSSKTWGDHVDHVYVKPAKTYVWRWINASLYSGSRYQTPKPSDHNPVLVNLYVP